MDGSAAFELLGWLTFMIFGDLSSGKLSMSNGVWRERKAGFFLDVFDLSFLFLEMPALAAS